MVNNRYFLHFHQADAELKTSSLAATEDALAKLGTSHSPYQLGTPRGAMNFNRVWRSPFCFVFFRGCWAVGCIFLILWSSAETEERLGDAFSKENVCDSRFWPSMVWFTTPIICSTSSSTSISIPYYYSYSYYYLLYHSASSTTRGRHSFCWGEL